MTKIKKYKNAIERFLSGDGGQRFFNFAYSIGAAIVIWGALFKILHLPGGNMLLSIGMGTEVLMFILTAFDRPPREYHWDKVFPELDNDADDEDVVAEPQGATRVIVGGRNAESAPAIAAQEAKSVVGIPENINISEADSQSLSESIAKMAAASDQLSRMAELTDATQQYLGQMAAISDQMQQLRATTEALNNVSEVLLQSYRAITENSENITASSTGYVEQMQSLNRNISGLNTIYEIQLKSVSSQLESIDRVNRGIKDIRDMYEKSAEQSTRYCSETEKMARYMQQLNSVYEKMITAMTINMYRPMMGADMPGAQSTASGASASDNENA